MTGKMKIRITLDMAMTVALFVLMGYIHTGDLAHEIVGTLIILLWAAHVAVNRKWYATLGRGRYSPGRIFNTAVNALLLLSAAGLILSSVILSSYVFTFLGIEGGMGFARILHMVTSYWFFLLSSLHLGLHWGRVAPLLGRENPLSRGAAILFSCLGVYFFFKNRIGSYLFAGTLFVFFDFEQHPLFFFFEYLCMMVLFASLTYYFPLRGRRGERSVKSYE